MNTEDLKNIKQVLKRKMDWAIGPEIVQFENKLVNYVNSTYCVAFNSGTSAGHAALIAGNINSGNIIVPSFTFISTANWPLMVNSKPKFSDIDEEHFGLDPKKLQTSITKNTKAIIPIHYAGLGCKIEKISKIAKKNNLLLIEDCAEALGSKINGKSVGTFGDMSIFSFAPNKIITTGEGGAVCTNSKKLYQKLLLIRSHGRVLNENYFISNSSPKYTFLGYNWRMSSMTAALGLSQFNKLEKIIKSRRKHANFYKLNLKHIKELILPYESKSYNHVYQLYTIRLTNNKIRNDLQKFLTKKGIMTKIFFEPIHLSNFYKKLGYKNKKLTNTEKISNTVLSLPIFPDLKEEEIRYICNSIKEFFEK